MSKDEQTNLVSSAKGLAKWFSVRVTIKIFGVTVWDFQYPPQNS